MPKAPFARLVREILHDIGVFGNGDLRIAPGALECLQEAVEQFVISEFESKYF
jgi:histone H3/H4